MDITDRILDDGTPWRLIKPKSADDTWCVLWLQGFTSTIEGHTEGCTRMAKNTNTAHALLNYAGHGDHPIKLEDATRRQQIEEVIAVYDELIKHGYSKIMVSGGSFGAYMTALLTSQRKVESLTLRAPAYYPDEEFDKPYRDTISATRRQDRAFYKDIIDDKINNKVIEAIKKYNGTTFVLEHEKDEVVHPSIPRTYFSVAKKGNYIVIPNTPHSPKTLPNPKPHYNLIEMWLATIVTATKESV